MNDIAERLKDAETATHALFNHIFQDAREEIERLRIENEALRAEVAHVKEVEFPRKAQTVADGWRGKCERLEAKIKAMERQEPVEWQSRTRPAWDDGMWTQWSKCSEGYAKDIMKASSVNDWIYEARPLYAIPVVQAAPSVPREAIEKMLTQLMDIAVSNGANSISMPDEYVEVAAWLCGIPAQPAPSFADAYQGAMEEVAIWKKRALEAEDLNRKFVAEINGPTYMGEPPHSKPDCGEAGHDEGRCGNMQCLPGAKGE